MPKGKIPIRSKGFPVKFCAVGRQVGVNAAYKIVRRRLYKSKAAMIWQDQVRKACPYTGRPVKCPVVVEVTFYFPSSVNDIDGPVKLLLDSLQGLVYLNDRQVVHLAINKDLDRKSPRTEIVVSLSPREEEARGPIDAKRAGTDQDLPSGRKVPTRCRKSRGCYSKGPEPDPGL